MTITSLENKCIKEINRLKDKKYRDLTGNFLIEGEHLVKEAIRENLVTKLIIVEGYSFTSNIPKIEVSENVMKKLSNMESPASILAVCKKRERKGVGNHILILEDIQDPGNVGTIIRSSAAFNIDTIILSRESVDIYNPKVIRSTQGMLFHINILYEDIKNTINYLKDMGYLIMGTKVTGGEDIKKISVSSKYALIIGNEGHGMSSEVSSLCDKYIYIKMNKKVESLNAAVATSILLYEISNKIDKE